MLVKGMKEFLEGKDKMNEAKKKGGKILVVRWLNWRLVLYDTSSCIVSSFSVGEVLDLFVKEASKFERFNFFFGSTKFGSLNFIFGSTKN